MKIVHLSDLHVAGNGRLSFGVANTDRWMQRSIEHLCSLDPPDLYVLTGDLADEDYDIAYPFLRGWLKKLERPVYIACGNHDERGILTKYFPDMCPVDKAVSPYICYTIDDLPMRIIVVDTSRYREHFGGLSEPVAEWLEEKVKEYHDKPTLVFTHHPPFRTGMGRIDEPFQNAGRFAEILQMHPNLHLCTGHVHRSVSTIWRGIPIVTCPPVSMLFDLDLSPGGGHSFVLGDPWYLVHHLWDGHVNTHTCIVPTQASYSGPYTFDKIHKPEAPPKILP